jgi:predicted membrane GTPase involved in stress response
LNKADRPTCRPEQVESDLFDLFATLGATDDQADYPLLYASAKQGWAQDTLPQLAPRSPTMTPLFDLIMAHVPPPIHLERASPFSMLTIQIEADPYVGTLYLGRIQSGVLRIGDTLWALNASGDKVGEGKVKKILGRRGLERVEKETAGAGEIVSIAGIRFQSNGGVNVTLVHPEGWGESGPKALPVCFFHSEEISTLTLSALCRQLPSIHQLSRFTYLLMTHPLLERKGPSSPRR